MSYKIIATKNFQREAKKLLKKYHSLKDELATLQEQLLENPRSGTLIKEDTYKIRLAVKSKGRGKSGGLRIITHIFEVEISLEEQTTDLENIIFLISIYDKSDIGNISDKELTQHLEDVQQFIKDEEE